MATLYNLHPETPQQRTVEMICKDLRQGAIMLYPTDTVYAIGCDLNDKNAVQRVRQLKQLSNNKPLTFLCSSLSNIAEYAVVADNAYRLMRRLIPGPYTFLLPATKQVPKLVVEPKRKTTGIRVPDRPICQEILQNLGNPIISTSAHLPDQDEFVMAEKAKLFDLFDKLVDIIIDDDQEPGYQTSSIIDLTDKEPKLVREGLGWEALQELL
ncbi:MULTISPECIES: L-threonylcarbamoyladenylate synthase [unclassified Synechocystis]|uniref:L-threonylcarbamoyladenylate synthase n=1 Tax=unclassified Synechocystis TaxID=2640012 RepID=UPI0003FA9055|nr:MULTISPECIES: L-threonylcarbamoyladenylate synthase [unclassified Synechocystis]AIE74234.1 YciO family [Synechocystis sp. PCC 6714]MCT0252862.1 threonylcarbamoyl-AMP synthase [Synechocystis sp. CS-94]